MTGHRFALLLLLSFGLPYRLLAQSNPAEPDILLLLNDEKLIGRFVRSDGSNVLFHSDSIGDVTVPWSKVKDLYSNRQFAIIEKRMNLGKNENSAKIAQGTISLNGERLLVQGPTGQERTLALEETSHVIDRTTFERAILRRAGFLQAWKGAVTSGVSIVQATQTSQTYTGAVSLIRAVPLEGWLDRRERTTMNLSAAYGTLTQPNTPKLRTEIFHADAEHDIYFRRRLFGFVQTAFDHNFSQGLNLAQNHGGGLGWTVVKRETAELDLKASISYLKQQFADSEQNQNLVGSIFAENYLRRLPRKLLLVQKMTIAPAWNNLNAYSGTADVTLTIPVYKRLMFTVGAADTFINNPSPGFRKNSFQATTGLTYTLP